jgi:hypothetical protein
VTTPATIPLAANDELAAVAWISSITGFTPAMVGTALPPPVGPGDTPAPWIGTGFVTVSVVGGSPDPLLPRNEPVIGVECWATAPGSNRPPWQLAMALASAITLATWNTRNISRRLIPDVNGVEYPPVTVQGAKMLTAFRRLYSDEADYACVSGDLWLSWVQPSLGPIA